MSGDPFRTVRQGEKFRPSASAWNSLAALATAQPGADFDYDITRINGFLPPMMWAQNSTGGNLDQYSPVAVWAPPFTPTQNLDEFLHRPALKVLKLKAAQSPPTNDLHLLAITLQPATSNSIVPVALAGIVPVKINVTHASHKYATFIDDDATKLKSDPFRGVRILWKESSGTGDTWAYVRLGQIFDTPLRFVRAKTAWRQAGGSDDSAEWDFVGYPLLNGRPNVGTVDTGQELTVRVLGNQTNIFAGNEPKSGWPNIQAGDYIAVEECEGDYIAVSGWIWDAKPGTLRLNHHRRGWAIANGTANSIANKGSGVDWTNKFLRMAASDGLVGGSDEWTLWDHDASPNSDIHDVSLSTTGAAAGAFQYNNQVVHDHDFTLPHEGCRENAAYGFGSPFPRNTADDGVRIDNKPAYKTMIVYERLNDREP